MDSTEFVEKVTEILSARVHKVQKISIAQHIEPDDFDAFTLTVFFKLQKHSKETNCTWFAFPGLSGRNQTLADLLKKFSENLDEIYA